MFYDYIINIRYLLTTTMSKRKSRNDINRYSVSIKSINPLATGDVYRRDMKLTS